MIVTGAPRRRVGQGRIASSDPRRVPIVVRIDMDAGMTMLSSQWRVDGTVREDRMDMSWMLEGPSG